MNTQLLAAIQWATSPDCFSDLARDIAEKSSKYTLSPKQEAVLLKVHGSVLSREAERVSRIAAGISAPSDRRYVSGVITKVFEGETEFGFVRKVYIDLDSGAKVRGNAPSASTPIVGQRVTFKATFKVSDRDPSSGYWSRPTDWEVKS